MYCHRDNVRFHKQIQNLLDTTRHASLVFNVTDIWNYSLPSFDLQISPNDEPCVFITSIHPLHPDSHPSSHRRLLHINFNLSITQQIRQIIIQGILPTLASSFNISPSLHPATFCKWHTIVKKIYDSDYQLKLLLTLALFQSLLMPIIST